MPTQENNNKAIEKSFAQLLRRLKEAKLQEAKRVSTLQSKFDMLNEGIKALENIQFTSVDDFQSVKELLEIQEFFSRSLTLKCFYFPVYKPLIVPKLLAYVEIKVQLDTLALKAHHLSCLGHSLAANEVKKVVLELRNLNRWYFSEEKIDYNDYKTRALQIIKESRPILAKHRGYKKRLGNLLILILTLGTAFIVHKGMIGDFLFFKQTDSAQQIEAPSQTLPSSYNH